MVYNGLYTQVRYKRVLGCTHWYGTVLYSGSRVGPWKAFIGKYTRERGREGGILYYFQFLLNGFVRHSCSLVQVYTSKQKTDWGHLEKRGWSQNLAPKQEKPLQSCNTVCNRFSTVKAFTVLLTAEKTLTAWLLGGILSVSVQGACLLVMPHNIVLWLVAVAVLYSRTCTVQYITATVLHLVQYSSQGSVKVS